MTDYERIPTGYRLIRSIGRGNTSQVYLATDPEGREVALKLPHPETLRVHDSAERFGNEVRLTLQFKHPHIVRGFAGTPFGPQAFLAIQYFPLGALSEQLVTRGLLAASQQQTTLLITHQLDQLSAWDSLWVMHHGKIVQQGCAAALSTQPGPLADLLARQPAREGK